MMKPLYIPRRKPDMPPDTFKAISRPVPGKKYVIMSWIKTRPLNKILNRIPRVNQEVFQALLNGGTVL